jgi:predicted AlkP superfamily phosphohydrolase/phosphomutase
LSDRIGAFRTLGMAEDHGGLNNGRISDEAFLEQCQSVLREREAMLQCELEEFRAGLFFCLFDTPDRLQHMFWRYREPEHPANAGQPPGQWRTAIEDHYRQCDAIVGRALQAADDRTLMIVLSDHGMGSFERGLHLNTWLHDHGFLALRNGLKPGPEAGDLLRGVDWSRTRAYAAGLGGLFLNLKGREAQGIVAPENASEVQQAIAHGLTEVLDADRGRRAVNSVVAREQVYAGAYAAESPDLLVNFAPGYRVSWGTPLGSVPAGLFEDNVKRWSGDHVVDPALVPGVLFMNRPFLGEGASLLDLAPTILAALGVPKGADMEGNSLLP